MSRRLLVLWWAGVLLAPINIAVNVLFRELGGFELLPRAISRFSLHKFLETEFFASFLVGFVLCATAVVKSEQTARNKVIYTIGSLVAVALAFLMSFVFGVADLRRF
jgi:hypothetical protein